MFRLLLFPFIASPALLHFFFVYSVVIVFARLFSLVRRNQDHKSRRENTIAKRPKKERKRRRKSVNFECTTCTQRIFRSIVNKQCPEMKRHNRKKRIIFLMRVSRVEAERTKKKSSSSVDSRSFLFWSLFARFLSPLEHSATARGPHSAIFVHFFSALMNDQNTMR